MDLAGVSRAQSQRKRQTWYLIVANLGECLGAQDGLPMLAATPSQTARQRAFRTCRLRHRLPRDPVKTTSSTCCDALAAWFMTASY